MTTLSLKIFLYLKRNVFTARRFLSLKTPTGSLMATYSFTAISCIHTKTERILLELRWCPFVTRFYFLQSYLFLCCPYKLNRFTKRLPLFVLLGWYFLYPSICIIRNVSSSLSFLSKSIVKINKNYF